MNPGESLPVAIPTPSEMDEKGATSTEYAILISFIASVIIAGVALFGTALNDYYVSLANHITSILA